MSIQEAYNSWSSIYDGNDNKTRDLDQCVTKEVLAHFEFDCVLELGCGSGKNTEYLISRAKEIVGLDFSEGMLAKAAEKITSDKVEFKKCDLNQPWPVKDSWADLVTGSLTLEHINDLHFIFRQAYSKLKDGGSFFISELHPFKQYAGSKAKFETEEGIQELEVFVHHVSDYMNAARRAGFQLDMLKEYFDEDGEDDLPRIISFVFKKIG